MDRARAIYERLLDYYGPQHWWPAETAFEAIVGALLMQQTSWRNVEVAIGNLKRARLLEVRALAETPMSVICSIDPGATSRGTSHVPWTRCVRTCLLRTASARRPRTRSSCTRAAIRS